MASALILAIGLGAHKIKEKREQKKERKALMEFANEQREAKLRSDRSSRSKGPSDRRRSESLEREEAEEDVPPPSYEEVVRGGARSVWNQEGEVPALTNEFTIAVKIRTCGVHGCCICFSICTLL